VSEILKLQNVTGFCETVQNHCTWCVDLGRGGTPCCRW